MNKRFRVLLACVVAAALAAALAGIRAQTPAPTGTAGSTPPLTADQALPLTCVQAWVASGKNYPSMLATVATLAKVSLANRELTFPNTREAGTDAGRGIAQDCKADPRALLYAVVDKHVRRVAETGK
jgi:hypothetical protein